MSKRNSEKEAELTKYKSLVLATLDFLLESGFMKVKTKTFDSDDHWRKLKIDTEEHYTKGRLTILKNWFRDLTEPMVENQDFAFNTYLHQKTNIDFDLFSAFKERIEKIIAKGKITTDNQFYDISILIDQLCQTEPQDIEKIDLLNNLVSVYEQRSNKK